MENQKKLNTRRLNDSIAIRPPMAIVAVDGLVEAARRIGLLRVGYRDAPGEEGAGKEGDRAAHIEDWTHFLEAFLRGGPSGGSVQRADTPGVPSSSA
jgi:hypothetical protein